MDFQEELDPMTQDIMVTGRVHIMSHSEAAHISPVITHPKTPEIFSSKLFEKFMEPSFLHKMVTEGTATTERAIPVEVCVTWSGQAVTQT